MRQIKTLGGALVAAFALASAVMTTSAMAVELPDITVTLGQEFPVTAEGELKGTEIATLTTAVSKLTVGELKATLKIEELTALGPGTIIFRKVKLGGTECNTETGVAGEVVVPKVEWHIVLLGFLSFDIDILFGPFTIKCNKLAIKITGPVISKLFGVNEGEEITSFNMETKCAAGSKEKQERETFTNDAGTVLSKLLIKADFGLGAENGCEATKTAVVLNTSKMIEVS